jgi:LmbE family N-acetylglucosaminyl deacetylase
VRLLRLVIRYDQAGTRAAFTPRSAITHRVSVRRYARQKQAAIAAHRSFLRSGGRSARLARVMLALPVPVFVVVFGREWFVEPGAAPGTRSGDIFQAVPRQPVGQRMPAAPGT